MSRYSVRSTQITHQNIDGEVIAIHFDTGVYYSMTGSAAAVWEQLVGGASVREIAESFPDRPADADGAIAAFLEELVREGLVEARDGSAPDGIAPGPNAWAPPRLDKFTDISDLIMADPIHGVDEMGWPNLLGPLGDPKA